MRWHKLESDFTAAYLALLTKLSRHWSTVHWYIIPMYSVAITAKVTPAAAEIPAITKVYLLQFTQKDCFRHNTPKAVLYSSAISSFPSSLR